MINNINIGKMLVIKKIKITYIKIKYKSRNKIEIICT